MRAVTGGIPIDYKLSAQHIEDDIDFALAAGADYIILDGRGCGTGAAPLLFRNHISVPTIPALARARRHLDKTGHSGRVTNSYFRQRPISRSRPTQPASHQAPRATSLLTRCLALGAHSEVSALGYSSGDS